MTTPLCAVDIETDGLHPGRRVWEVALIRRDEHGERERQFFVAIDLRHADPKGLQVGRFWTRHPVGKFLSTPPKDPSEHPPTAEERSDAAAEHRQPCPPVLSKFDAARVVMKWTFGAHLIGVNPAFDAETLAGLIRGEGYIESWHYHLIDMVALSVGWLSAGRPHHVRTGDGRPIDWPDGFDVVDGPPWKSDQLSRACGIEPPKGDRHTALADAKWALRWYDKLTGGDE